MDSDVQKIKDKLSIVEVVGQYIKLQRAGSNYRALCPFHKEKTPSFMISPERGTYMCFGCGEKGDIFSFVQKIEGVEFPVALKELAGKAGVELTRTSVHTKENTDQYERLLKVLEEATYFFELQLKNRPDVRSYLVSRGATEETIQAWRLGYAPASWRKLSEYLVAKGYTKNDIVDAGLAAKSEKKPGEVYDRFRGRIMFPMFDTSGRTIAFSGRFFEKVPSSHEEGEPAKYVNSPETVLFKKSRVLYGFDRAKQAIRKADCILLVEGQFDLILSHQSGLPFAVALSGTALTKEHLSLLGHLSKRLVLALDADSAGIRAGMKSTMMAFQAGFDVKVPTFPEGKDPADVARENPELLKAAIRTSQTAIEFFLDALRRNLPPGRQEDERAYKKLVEMQVVPLIAALGSAIDQEHFIHIVADRLRVPDAAVRAEVAKKPAFTDEIPQDEKVMVPTHGLSALEEKIGMLLFYFEFDSEVGKQLHEVLGELRHKEYKEKLENQAEVLRFKFESEMSEHVETAHVAGDMLRSIELTLIEEEIVLARADTGKIMQLVRRKEELRR